MYLQVPRSNETAVDEVTPVRFSANAASATVWPSQDGSLWLTCLGEPALGNRPLSIFEPAGPSYALTTLDLERIGADIRCFLSGRRDGFVRSGRGS
jgi:hypothetical protein